MCSFQERVYNCGHYTKSCNPCDKAKKVKAICTSGNKTTSVTTGTPTCGIYGCDGNISLKREGPGKITDGDFDEDDMDWS
ncbi:hypothetical protein K469DRAFT_585684 [Zopfia rhizophila CBS 207.26]|uniref:Uncharacterized protein n=1 Tax=Zopfia rhizophila CBS 207.26 TaxID=1314779 RepID=A0A6A6DSK3_9PEZI|nr:hypothetical protein K469DRAFT_585684 [Zopfia rhizophila CBS 207.26]